MRFFATADDVIKFSNGTCMTYFHNYKIIQTFITKTFEELLIRYTYRVEKSKHVTELLY